MTESRKREEGDLVRVEEDKEEREETVSSTGAGEEETAAGITKRSCLRALRVGSLEDEDAEAEEAEELEAGSCRCLSRNLRIRS